MTHNNLITQLEVLKRTAAQLLPPELLETIKYENDWFRIINNLLEEYKKTLDAKKILTISSRLKELLLNDELILNEEGFSNQHIKIEYEWSGNYERLEVKTKGSGGLQYSGMYHPNIECIGNPCKYCGHTWIE